MLQFAPGAHRKKEQKSQILHLSKAGLCISPNISTAFDVAKGDARNAEDEGTATPGTTAIPITVRAQEK